MINTVKCRRFSKRGKGLVRYRGFSPTFSRVEREKPCGSSLRQALVYRSNCSLSWSCGIKFVVVSVTSLSLQYGTSSLCACVCVCVEGFQPGAQQAVTEPGGWELMQQVQVSQPPCFYRRRENDAHPYTVASWRVDTNPDILYLLNV